MEKLRDLLKEERKEILKDVNEMIVKEADERPVILELENIRVPKAGKFELDLLSLFRKKPVIYKYGEGKYVIDLASTFQMLKK